MTSLIKLELYTQGDDSKYEGRLLGLIDNKEFNALLNNKTVQGKVFTKESIPLTDLMGLGTDVADMRLVMTVKSKVEDKVPAKTLFVSDKLSLVSYESRGKDGGKDGEVIMDTINGECLFITEV